ncbi:MAG TPA: lanthionine synthetase LanC family protein [Myxococcales bacterium]|nr:lanthionine synthetase LanC family protein [Myxococcales bacterium]
MSAPGTTRAFTPVLEGAAAAAALDAAERIASSLPAEGPPDLAGGCAGFAVAHAALHRLRPDRGHDLRALEAISAAAARISSEPLRAGLWDGVCGVAWAATYLEKCGLLEEEDDPAAEIDAGLADALSRGWTRSMDVVTGLAGVIAYLVERLPRPAAVGALPLALQRLEEAASGADGGLLWRTPAADLAADERARSPEGASFLGVAHGAAGIAAAAARALAAGVDVERGRRLVRGAASAILAHQGPPAIAGQPEPARGSWCHGAPATAAALLSAARALDDAGVAERARAIASAAAAAGLEAPGVSDDGGLCHGPAGAAHLHARLYQHTGDEASLIAGRRWMKRALEVAPPEAPGLLQGRAGHALAIAAAAAAVEPDWDRPLLLVL